MVVIHDSNWNPPTNCTLAPTAKQKVRALHHKPHYVIHLIRQSLRGSRWTTNVNLFFVGKLRKDNVYYLAQSQNSIYDWKLLTTKFDKQLQMLSFRLSLYVKRDLHGNKTIVPSCSNISQ